MTQNREPPAFQEYPANMLARIEFRMLSLAGRGLLYTMRNECWVNRSLPAQPALLAKVLGLAENEVVVLLPGVMCFFEEVESEIRSPELDDYRRHLEERRAKQSKGGKKGADKTNGGKDKTADKGARSDPSTPSGTPAASGRVSRQVPRRPLSTAQQSTDQHSEKKLTGEDDGSDEFMRELGEPEGFTAEQYRRATGR